MGVGVCLDIIYFVLLQISQIAESHFSASYRKVDSQHLPERRLIVQGSEFYHSARVAQGEYLIIGLSVVR